jgi:hypothetical protein
MHLDTVGIVWPRYLPYYSALRSYLTTDPPHSLIHKQNLSDDSHSTHSKKHSVGGAGQTPFQNHQTKTQKMRVFDHDHEFRVITGRN